MPLGRSAPGLDGPEDLGRKLAVVQQLVDKRAEDLLSGDASQSETVGCLSLPDIETPVLGRGEVDGASGAPPPRLPDGGEPFGDLGPVQ